MFLCALVIGDNGEMGCASETHHSNKAPRMGFGLRPQPIRAMLRAMRRTEIPTRNRVADFLQIPCFRLFFTGRHKIALSGISSSTL
jgi:hypothetical protein